MERGVIELVVALASLLVAMVAIWMAWRLRREILDFKREQYDLGQKVKAVHSQIESTVDPLRIQLALVAQGKPVSNRLIRTGRLYHEISAAEASEFLTTDSSGARILWLDVRSGTEFAQRHIPGAQLLPVENLEMRFQAEVPLVVEKIIVYCTSGDRSRLACEFLSRHDYGNVYHMKDGLKGWAGPIEGNEVGGLIQILSKSKLNTQVSDSLPTSAHSS
jgi:rhodanese-related sulfurtransferase